MISFFCFIWLTWHIEFQGPDSESTPYIVVEIAAIAVFDTKDTCKVHAPKIFQALTKFTGQPQENIHVLMKPLEKHNVAVNGAIKEWSFIQKQWFFDIYFSLKPMKNIYVDR